MGIRVLIKGDYVWGSNGTVLNNMILMGLAYDLSNESQYLESMRASMDYIMGRNPVNTSYVTVMVPTPCSIRITAFGRMIPIRDSLRHPLVRFRVDRMPTPVMM